MGIPQTINLEYCKQERVVSASYRTPPSDVIEYESYFFHAVVVDTDVGNSYMIWRLGDSELPLIFNASDIFPENPDPTEYNSYAIPVNGFKTVLNVYEGAR